MHWPFSEVVETSDFAWLSGTLSTKSGDSAEEQVHGTIANIDKTLESIGLSKANAVHIDIVVPTSLSESDLAIVIKACDGYGEKNVIRAAKTCMDCQVELCCVAKKNVSGTSQAPGGNAECGHKHSWLV